jgi:hypothetical protein
MAQDRRWVELHMEKAPYSPVVAFPVIPVQSMSAQM